MEEYRVDLTPSQIADLQTLVAGQVSTNESVLDQHGRDESAFPPVRPSAVVMASTTEEVSRVLKYCNEQRIPVVAFGAGSSLEGHVLPLHGGVSLDLTPMNKISSAWTFLFSRSWRRCNSWWNGRNWSSRNNNCALRINA